MSTYYFAYGADMDADELDLHHDRRRRPRLHFAKSTPAVLKGYRLICDISSKYRRAGIFNVVPDSQSNVCGVIYELHPGDTLSIVALKEGEEADYALSLLPVKTTRGEEIPALVLHAEPGASKLKPSDAYLDIVIKAARHHKLASDWIDQLKTWRVVP
jgi:hypothetical protein